MIKKVGIVADNFKLNKFKKELSLNGFNDYNIYPFTDVSSTIQVNAEDNRLIEFRNICIGVNMHFLMSN